MTHLDQYFEDDLADDECGECDGIGWVEGDCFEDTCCCADPETQHGMVRCFVCNPCGEKD